VDLRILPALARGLYMRFSGMPGGGLLVVRFGTSMEQWELNSLETKGKDYPVSIAGANQPYCGRCAGLLARLGQRHGSYAWAYGSSLDPTRHRGAAGRGLPARSAWLLFQPHSSAFPHVYAMLRARAVQIAAPLVSGSHLRVPSANTLYLQ